MLSDTTANCFFCRVPMSHLKRRRVRWTVKWSFQGDRGKMHMTSYHLSKIRRVTYKPHVVAAAESRCSPSSSSQTPSLYEQLPVLLHVQLGEPVRVRRGRGKHQRPLSQRAAGEAEHQSGGAPGRAAVAHPRHPHRHLHAVGRSLRQGVRSP